LLLWSIMLIYLFSRENIRVDFNDRYRRLSPLYTMIFFGTIGLIGFMVVFLQGISIEFITFTYCIAMFSSMYIFTQWIITEGTDGSLRRTNLFHRIKVSDVICAMVSLFFNISWLSGHGWISNNVLAISIIFVILWTVQVKRFIYIFMLLLAVFLYDSAWYFFTDNSSRQSFSTFSAYLDLPVKLIIPRMTKTPMQSCISIGIGDIIFPALFYKFCKQFDTQILRNIKYANLVLIGYAIGVLQDLMFITSFEIIRPVFLHIVPMMLVIVVIAAVLQKDLEKIMKFNMPAEEAPLNAQEAEDNPFALG